MIKMIIRMKRCSKCKIEYGIDEFYKNSLSIDGHRHCCKHCCKQYREGNKEYMKEYRINNREKLNDNRKKRYDPKSEKNYYSLNKEKILLRMKIKYNLNRKEKIEYQKNYQSNNKDKRNAYLSKRRKTDPMFRLITNTRNLINNSFYEMGYSKSSKTQEILGCSFVELKLYLESKFDIWMNWDNRGDYNGSNKFGWDIDHIIPLSSAKSKADLIRLNHFSNLQPLCSRINRDIKKNNIEYGII